jgi:hypothetical protein
MDGQFEAPTNELEMCKAALCFKEHELIALRTDVQAQHANMQALSKSVERIERTLSAGMDRIARTMNRLGRGRDLSPMNSNYADNTKRRKIREN